MSGDDDVTFADLGDVTICHRLAGPEDGRRVVYVSGSGSDLRREPNALSPPSSTGAGSSRTASPPPANQEAMLGQLPDASIEWFEGGHAFFIEDRTAYPEMADFVLS